MSEIVLLLRNTDRLEEVEHFVTYFSTLRLCQRLFYFYEILAAFNKLKIMPNVGLLLRNTDRLQQVEEDYIRDCTTSTKY